MKDTGRTSGYHPSPGITRTCLWAFTRTLGDEVRLVLANCSSETVRVPADDVPDLTGATLLLGTHGAVLGPDLEPWESKVYALGGGAAAHAAGDRETR